MRRIGRHTTEVMKRIIVVILLSLKSSNRAIKRANKRKRTVEAKNVAITEPADLMYRNAFVIPLGHSRSSIDRACESDFARFSTPSSMILMRSKCRVKDGDSQCVKTAAGSSSWEDGGYFPSQ